MLDGLGSMTSQSVTLARSYAAGIDPQHLFDDPYARQFLPPGSRWLMGRKRFLRAYRFWHELLMPGLLGEMLLRARYAEALLRQRAAEGLRQYLILGAGWDSFALRRGAWAQDLQIFEIDHPATQARKRRRLQRLGVDLPDNLHFVAVDFERETISDALARTAFDPQAPVLVNWLGVTYYLQQETVLAVLRELARMAQGGCDVVFDYMDAEVLAPRPIYKRALWHRLSVRMIGEPFLAAFDPLTLDQTLRSCGFELREHWVGFAQRRLMHQLDFTGLQAPPYMHLAYATRPVSEATQYSSGAALQIG